MTNALINAIKKHASILDQQMPQPRFATVTSYDPNTHRAKVQIQPDGVISGWLPVMSTTTGSGFGITCGLVLGQQVVILPQEGSANSYIVMGAVYSAASAPPKVNSKTSLDASGGELVGAKRFGVDSGSSASSFTQSGEVSITTQNGGILRFNIDGSMYLETQGAGFTLVNGGAAWVIQTGGVSIQMDGGGILITAPQVTTTGNLAVGTGATGTFATAAGNVVTVADGIIINIA